VADIQRDITRTVLAVIFIVALIGSSIWILRPFLGAIVWATTVVVATWSFMISVQKWLGNKRVLAVIVMTLLLVCVLVVPLTFAIGAIASNLDDIAIWVKDLASFRLPPPPTWLESLPLVGPKAVELWERVAIAGQRRRHSLERSVRQLGHLLQAGEHIRTATDPTAERTGSRCVKYDVLGVYLVQRGRVVAIAVEHFLRATHACDVGMLGRNSHSSMLLYAIRRRSSAVARHRERRVEHHTVCV